MSRLISAVEDGVALAVRLQPRASKTEIAGAVEGVLRVRVTAPPVEGAANEALVRLLAARLGVAPSRVEIRSGERGRNKVVLIRGIEARLVAQRLGVPVPEAIAPPPSGRQ